MFKQMGVGLAFAVLLDATVIRGVLLPARMKLLGDRNWWLPRSLGWLPQIEHDGKGPGGRHRLSPNRSPSVVFGDRPVTGPAPISSQK